MKGKDWYAILAPESFGKKKLGEMPVTDAKAIRGKVIEVSLPEVIGQTPKFYIMLKFKVDRLDGNNALTRFHGCRVVKEQIYRVVRKRATKVQVTQDVSTKDGWELSANTIVSLKGGANSSSQTAVRLAVKKWMDEFGKRSTIHEFVTAVISGAVQLNMKKTASKVYPARFAEVIRVSVAKSPTEAPKK